MLITQIYKRPLTKENYHNYFNSFWEISSIFMKLKSDLFFFFKYSTFLFHCIVLLVLDLLEVDLFIQFDSLTKPNKVEKVSCKFLNNKIIYFSTITLRFIIFIIFIRFIVET